MILLLAVAWADDPPAATPESTAPAGSTAEVTAASTAEGPAAATAEVTVASTAEGPAASTAEVPAASTAEGPAPEPVAEEGLDAYLASRLEVIEAKVSTVYAPGYDGSGQFWFVVDRHGNPLDVTDLASRLGDDEVADQIRRKRRAGSAGAIALAAGGVGLFFGGWVVAHDVASPVMVGLSPVSVVSSFLVLSRNVRRHHPSNAYSEDEARERVEAYNAEQRDRLLGP